MCGVIEILIVIHMKKRLHDGEAVLNHKKANDILNLIADLKKMFKKAEKFQPQD